MQRAGSTSSSNENRPLLPVAQGSAVHGHGRTLNLPYTERVQDFFQHPELHAVGRDAACLAVGGVAAAGTYGLTQAAFTLRARAPVSTDPTFWQQAARLDIYGRCYEGCAAELFPNDVQSALICAQEACATSARVLLANVTCNANLMWNWLDRVPQACLPAAGDILHERALAEAGRHTMHHVVVGILLGALVGTIGTLLALRRTRSLLAP